MRALLVWITVFGACLAALVYADVLLTAAGLGADGAARAMGNRLFESAAWVAGTFMVIAAVNRYFWDGVVARAARRPVPPLLKSASSGLLLVVGVASIASVVFGRNVTGIWATSGAIGLVLGLALRTFIQDIFTGIFMNIDGAVKPGDWVTLHHGSLTNELYGQIVDIGWRTSRVQLENGNIVVVPNGLMGTMAVTNFAHADHVSRLETEVVVDFEVPPERARRILLAGARAAVAAKGILGDPAPAVIVGEPTDRGVAYKVRFWGKVSESSPSHMQDAVMTQLLRHLRIAGLTPAFPKEDVFFDRRPKRLLLHETLEDRVEVLSRIDLFGKTLEARELAQLAAGVTIVSYEAGHVLVRQGEPGTSMFVIVEGMLDVVIDRADGAAPMHVNHIGAGEILGEMSLLTGEPRSASVVATTGVVAYEIRRDHFETILAHRPVVAESMSELVAQHRVRTDTAMRAGNFVERERETRRLKEQILGKMRAVFRALLDHRGDRNEGQAAG